MRLYAEINKKIGGFHLRTRIESNAKKIGILGASGSGKSMTLRSIAGIETPDSGRIEINGNTLYDSEKKINLKPQKRNIGYMFQNYALFPTMTVLQNVCCGLKGDKNENRALAMEMIEKMGLRGLENRLPGELSGGQQQRVALARIMVCKPQVILLDEPFSALDLYLRDRMQHEMLEMLEDYEGQTIMVSHNRDELYRFSDDLFVIQDGIVLQHGERDEIFDSPASYEIAKLTGCKNISTVRIVDGHTLEAEDWGVTLKLEKDIPEGTKYVGYRAHHYIPVWGERKKNCLKCTLLSADFLPFETNYYIQPETGSTETDKRICWFVQKKAGDLLQKNGMPDYLEMTEDYILLLK